MNQNTHQLFFFLSFFLFSFLRTTAQQNHFVYIQTENKQPFYVKLDQKIFSSSASGYLIIPKLSDGVYTISIGFPKNEWPEQKVTYAINKKDAGYLLKNFEEKGWGLFNLQTLEVMMPVGILNDIQNKDRDTFSSILSNVVNDPAVAQNEMGKINVRQSDTGQLFIVNSSITKLYYTVDSGNIKMVYMDKAEEISDTVEIIIPVDSVLTTISLVSSTQKLSIAEAKPDVKNKDPRFIDMELTNINAKPVPDSAGILPTAIQQLNVTEVKKQKQVDNTTGINSECKNVASEQDFLKLRKKMVQEDNDDDMVTVARKIFKTKCFTTEQVKNLGVLFLKDDGRYKLYDAAFPFVSDLNNFNVLQNQLTDPYFVNRFRAMVSK